MNVTNHLTFCRKELMTLCSGTLTPSPKMLSCTWSTNYWIVPAGRQEHRTGPAVPCTSLLEQVLVQARTQGPPDTTEHQSLFCQGDRLMYLVITANRLSPRDWKLFGEASFGSHKLCLTLLQVKRAASANAPSLGLSLHVRLPHATGQSVTSVTTVL